MGAVLASAVPGLRCPEEASLRAPESVVDLHVGFIRAGAELIETNTFGANRPKLAQHFLEEQFERLNEAAVGAWPKQRGRARMSRISESSWSVSTTHCARRDNSSPRN